jgi:integrase
VAWLKDKGGVWHVAFRWRGREIERSLFTRNANHAERLKARIELHLQSVKQGLATLPQGVDEIEWLATAGQANRRLDGAAEAVRTLDELLARYSAAMPQGSRAESTVATEAIHHKWLREVLGKRASVLTIGAETLQRYIAKRSVTVKPVTIRKELASLHTAWAWAHEARIAPEPPRIEKLRYAKQDEQPPFMHAEQIRREIKTRKLHGPAARALWESLVMTMDEVREFVAFLRSEIPHPWVADMFEVAAFTGARRSELCRMMTGDVDLERGTITVRDKKRVRTRSESRRVVQIAKGLRPTLERLTTTDGPLFRFRGNAVTPEQIREQWKQRRPGTEWEYVKGLHVMRHSFASNLAAKGVSQALIDQWMGHTTEEIRARYRHFFPAEKDKAIDALG